MATSEEKLHKLKVPELKELLAKHNLPQTGKKDDLIKRLVENNVSTEEEEELITGLNPKVDPPDESPATNVTESTSQATKAADPTSAAGNGEPANTSNSAAPPSTDAPAALTPDQQAMKARAERFGVPFNPNPPTSSRSQPPKSSAPSSSSAPDSAAKPKTEPKPKAGAIDKAPVGISDDLLAKRAARFGLPEKKVGSPAGAGAEGSQGSAAAAAPPTKPPSKKALQTADAEISPEQAAKMAEDEEKKRKRAEKFGTGPATSTAATNGTEPDAKKAKV